MRFSKLVILIIYKIFLLAACLIISGFAFLVCQAPDSTYILDSNYVLWKWPGRLIRLEPTYWDDMNMMGVEYIDPLKDYDVNAIAVLDKFIIGRASNGWFAINRETHKVLYPYESKEKLKSEAMVIFSDSDLTTSRPWARLVIHLRTKIALTLVWLFFAMGLIGFHRTRKGVKFLFKGIQRLLKKPTVT